MKLLYKPFGIVAGIIGARIGENTFKTIWARVDGGEPPKAGTPDASLQRIVAASALEAAALAGARAATDRLTMRWFHYLTGIWPGDKVEPEADGQTPERA